MFELKYEHFIYSEGFANPTTNQLGYYVFNPKETEIFNSSTDFLWIKEMQVEQKEYCTYYAENTRTTTNSILDLTNNHILTATSLTYQENDIPVFDGVNNYISTNIDTLTTSATYIVWLNRFQSVGAYNMFMGSHLPYFAFRSGNNIHFSMNISGQKSLYAGSGLQNNTWYMLAFVHDFDGTNTTAKIFINSALGAEATYTGSQATNTGRTFQISGWRSDNPTDHAFNGKISAVQIYNRALSEQEIRQNFNAHRNRYGV